MLNNSIDAHKINCSDTSPSLVPFGSVQLSWIPVACPLLLRGLSLRIESRLDLGFSVDLLLASPKVPCFRESLLVICICSGISSLHPTLAEACRQCYLISSFTVPKEPSGLILRASV